MRYMLSFGLLFLSVTVSSQPILFGTKLRLYATGETARFIPCNPASLARAENSSLSLTGIKNFMLVPAMSLSASTHAGKSAFGFGLNYLGTQLHAETEANISYGRDLGNNISGGIGFGLVQTRIPGYINKSEGIITAGVLIHLTKELVTAMNIRKQVRPSGTEKSGGGMYHAGLGYTVSEMLLIVMEIEKEEERPPFFRTGLEYLFRKELHASIGFVTGTDTWFFGSGIRFNSCTAEALFSYHPSLGWTPSLSFFFQMKKKQK